MEENRSENTGQEFSGQEIEQKNTEIPGLEPIDQKKGVEPKIPQKGSGVEVTGSRQALRDIRRQLTDDELYQSGALKLLLQMLVDADDKCQYLGQYADRFHEADKNVAVLNEKLKSQTSIEIFFGVGVCLGGAMIGVAPSLFTNDSTKCFILIAIGACLIIGAVVGRIIKQ